MPILNPGIQPSNAEIIESYLFIADKTPLDGSVINSQTTVKQ